MASPIPKIANYTVPAGDSLTIKFDVDPDDEGMTLAGATVNFRVYDQEHGTVDPDAEPLIEKEIDDGIYIFSEEDQKLWVTLEEEDTVDLDPKNYYYEVTVTYDDEARSTIGCGIMTVTFTINRVEE